MTMREYIVTRIWELCDERRMSINELSHSSGVAPTTIKNIIYGQSQNPGVVTLNNICRGFGITLVEFFDTTAFRLVEPELQGKDKK